MGFEVLVLETTPKGMLDEERSDEEAKDERDSSRATTESSCARRVRADGQASRNQLPIVIPVSISRVIRHTCRRDHECALAPLCVRHAPLCARTYTRGRAPFQIQTIPKVGAVAFLKA